MTASATSARGAHDPSVAAPAATPGTLVIEPGIYDMPEAAYHADPVPDGSLSHSGARLVLTCPAKYAYRQGREVHSADFDFGKAAHRIVLGAGSDLVVIDAADWRTKDAREERDEARASGLIPCLAYEYEIVEAMASAIIDHPIAGRLFGGGKSEQSMFWQQHDVWLRARPDYLPPIPTNGRRAVIPDYKTTRDASHDAFSRTVANFGYHQQAAWYLDGWRALTETDAAFVFVAQEKEAPYLVNVVELDSTALEIGAARNRCAVEIWKDCRKSGRWPGYGDTVGLVTLPRWAVIAHEQSIEEQDTGGSW